MGYFTSFLLHILKNLNFSEKQIPSNVEISREDLMMLKKVYQAGICQQIATPFGCLNDENTQCRVCYSDKKS